VLKSKYKRNNN